MYTIKNIYKRAAMRGRDGFNIIYYCMFSRRTFVTFARENIVISDTQCLSRRFVLFFRRAHSRHQ